MYGIVEICYMLLWATNQYNMHVVNVPQFEDARSNVYFIILYGTTIRNLQPQKIILRADIEIHLIYIICGQIRRYDSFDIILL